MCIQMQEEDLEFVQDKLQEIIDLARNVVKGGKDGIASAFSICIRCREIQGFIENQGILQEVEQSCLAK